MQPAYASNVHLPGYKYEQAGSAIVAGTQARRWTGYAAELRRHVRTGAEDFVQAVTEVAIAISGRAAIERRGDQKTQKFDALAGTYCICPAGSQVDFLHQESGTVEVLHLFFADLNPPAAPISRTPVGVDWPYRGGLQARGAARPGSTPLGTSKGLSLESRRVGTLAGPDCRTSLPKSSPFLACVQGIDGEDTLPIFARFAHRAGQGLASTTSSDVSMRSPTDFSLRTRPTLREHSGAVPD
jgi:hypothetical protein